MELSRKFSFEAGHRLAKGYVGGCSNIHGHSWNCEIFVTIAELDIFGMGVDFAFLKLVAKDLEDTYDHKFMAFEGDKPVVNFCKENAYALVEMEDNPTSEHLAMCMAEQAQEFIDKYGLGFPVTVSKIIVRETENSMCVYEPKKKNCPGTGKGK